MINVKQLFQNKDFRRGFVFAAGALIVADILLFHLALDFHHVIEGRFAFKSDLVALALGIILLLYGLLKE